MGFPGIAYLYARKTMVKRFVWLLALMVVTAACLDEPDCYNLNNDVIGISFKELEDSSTDTVSLVCFRRCGTSAPCRSGYDDIARIHVAELF